MAKTKSCPERLEELTDAYYNLVSGCSVQEVTMDDETTRFHKGNMVELLRAIRTLHSECGCGPCPGVPQRRKAARMVFGCEDSKCDPCR